MNSFMPLRFDYESNKDFEYERVVLDSLLKYADSGKDYQRVYGGRPVLRMVRGNEYSQPISTGYSPGVTVGFPLQKYSIDEDWHKQRNQALFEAIFNPVNDLEYEDYLVDYKRIPVYSLLNGDGKPIPVALDGTPFDSNTHTHYTASKEFDENVLRNLCSNVLEHGCIGIIELHLNHTQSDILINDCEDMSDEDKVAFCNPKFFGEIGMFDGVSVFVSPFVSKNKALCIDLGVVDAKPLFLRRTPILTVWGLGVCERHMAAAHQFGTETYSYSENELED